MGGHQQPDLSKEIKVGSIVRISEGIHKDKEAKVIHMQTVGNSILGEGDEDNIQN